METHWAYTYWCSAGTLGNTQNLLGWTEKVTKTLIFCEQEQYT